MQTESESEHRKVGMGIVRAFKEVVQSKGANRGLLVTTSHFTKDAKQKNGVGSVPT
jgi:restriction endonuclease Mrr